ncbi:phage integrase [Sporolactobacillus inulinus]|uniref:Phage integrase n=1 Tax=Sporolactobacillus inulinus TaxID=2078 RepID=A0A4Y1ZI97_9BACL|nr:site-specific integrase [Sporolactobacillus inulinus]GAY78703.1 phage integrase [Sporolactobacillus inulinus]
MASIQKRGKTYQYTISRRINGVQKPIRKGGFRSGKEAATAAKEIELQLVKGLNPVLKPVIFADYFEQWIELYKVPKVSKITLEHYKYSLRAVKDFFKDTPMQNIRRPDYQKFLNWFGSTRAKETLAKVNGHIKSCVDDALEDQIVHLNFTRKAELNWTVPAKKEADKFLNYQDEERLMEKIWSKRDLGIGYSLLLLAAVSGMRFEELVGLTRSDFDFNKGTIRINKTWDIKNINHGVLDQQRTNNQYEPFKSVT